jgi:hypothetical protein
MNIKVIDKINMNPAYELLESDELWLYSANEWKRLISKYVPRRTGQLMSNVEVKTKEVHYKSAHAMYVYHGKLYVDPKYKVGGFTNDGTNWWSRPGIKKVPSGRDLKMRRDGNPNASKEWDKAAIKDKQDLLLIKSMQSWINKNL